MIYKDDHIRQQESIANQETLQEEEEAKEQEFYEGDHDGLFNDEDDEEAISEEEFNEEDDLFENMIMTNKELEERRI